MFFFIVYTATSTSLSVGFTFVTMFCLMARPYCFCNFLILDSESRPAPPIVFPSASLPFSPTLKVHKMFTHPLLNMPNTVKFFNLTVFIRVFD